MIDIHCHILPGLDDGAANMEQAAAMTVMAAADGITEIVATPHASPRYCYDRGAVEELIDTVRRHCASNITIHCGCDFHLSLENILDVMTNPWRYVIDETAYLLVELPTFFNGAAMSRVFDEMIAAGMIPIVTHPERHPVLQRQPEILKPWVERGCLVQITAQSILGEFGRSARSSALELMRSGLAHFVASDAHDTRRRPPLLSQAWKEVRKRHGAAFADVLFTGNPSKALEGNVIAASTKPARGLLGFRY